MPSSRPAACGPSGLAIPGSCRPFADVLSAHPGLRLFLSAADASGEPLLVVFCLAQAVYVAGGGGVLRRAQCRASLYIGLVLSGFHPPGEGVFAARMGLWFYADRLRPPGGWEFQVACPGGRVKGRTPAS